MFLAAKFFPAFLRGAKHALAEFRPSHDNLPKSQQFLATRTGRIGTEDLDSPGNGCEDIGNPQRSFLDQRRASDTISVRGRFSLTRTHSAFLSRVGHAFWGQSLC